MSGAPVFVTSDVHLGAISPARERAFLAWLEYAGARAGSIVLNGDLFDFWFEFRGGVPPGHDPVLELLRDVVQGGVPVTLMGGNHDWWGGPVLREEVGVEFLQKPEIRDVAGFRTLLAHGDGLGSGDLGYRILKSVLRGRPTRWAFALLPPRVGTAVAQRVTRTPDRGADPTESEKQRAIHLRSWAVRRLEEDPGLDLVILGHTHIPELRQVEVGRWYLNAGDWVHHRSYAVLREGEPPRLEEWGG